jgi:SAM-dependent methyltransferase
MIGMSQTPEELHRVAARTLAHYDRNAQGYWEGTRDHDVRQNIEALLAHIDVPPPFTLLDFGCGPGRDLSAFKALGHQVVGLDGSAQLAAIARENSGCEVLVQNFLELDLPAVTSTACSPTRCCSTSRARSCHESSGNCTRR